MTDSCRSSPRSVIRSFPRGRLTSSLYTPRRTRIVVRPGRPAGMESIAPWTVQKSPVPSAATVRVVGGGPPPEEPERVAKVQPAARRACRSASHRQSRRVSPNRHPYRFARRLQRDVRPDGDRVAFHDDRLVTKRNAANHARYGARRAVKAASRGRRRRPGDGGEIDGVGRFAHRVPDHNAARLAERDRAAEGQPAEERRDRSPRWPSAPGKRLRPPGAVAQPPSSAAPRRRRRRRHGGNRHGVKVGKIQPPSGGRPRARPPSTVMTWHRSSCSAAG